MSEPEKFDINTYINSHLALLEITHTIMPSEAENRASQLLRAVAVIAWFRLSLSNQLSQVSSLRDIAYKDNLVNSDCKNVTEKKVVAEASPEYIKNRENFEILDSNVKYLSTVIDVFNNGHILFRQMSKSNV
jgi:hypothetical protein